MGKVLIIVKENGCGYRAIKQTAMKATWNQQRTAMRAFLTMILNANDIEYESTSFESQSSESVGSESESSESESYESESL